MSWAAKIWPMLRASGDLHELIAQLLVESRGDWAQIPGFVVVSFTAESAVVAIRGDLTATFQSADREYRVGGPQIKTWEEYHLPPLESLWLGTKTAGEDSGAAAGVCLDGYAPMAQLRWSKHKDLRDDGASAPSMPSPRSLKTRERESTPSSRVGDVHAVGADRDSLVSQRPVTTPQVGSVLVGVESKPAEGVRGGAPEAEMTTGPTPTVRPAEVFGPLALSQNAGATAADRPDTATTRTLGSPASATPREPVREPLREPVRSTDAPSYRGDEEGVSIDLRGKGVEQSKLLATEHTHQDRPEHRGHEFPRMRRRQGRIGQPAESTSGKTLPGSDVSADMARAAGRSSDIANVELNLSSEGFAGETNQPQDVAGANSLVKLDGSRLDAESGGEQLNSPPQELQFSSADFEATTDFLPAIVQSGAADLETSEGATQRTSSPNLAPVDRRRILRPVDGLAGHSDDDNTTALLSPSGQTLRPSQVAGVHSGSDEASTVLSVLCANGHPNPPRREGCYICGAPVMGRQQLMPRPSLGVVRVSTGQEYQLDRDVLFGRAPTQTDMGRPEPHLVYLDAPEISAMHVMIKVDGWSAVALDRRSTNGTTLVREGLQPTLLEHGVEIPLQSGDILDLGDGATAMVGTLP